MALEFRKIGDVGVNHPVVARLGVQASDLIQWVDIEDGKRKERSVAAPAESTGGLRSRRAFLARCARRAEP
jgi:hypothetical protein